MQAKLPNSNPLSQRLRRIGGPFRERRASHTDIPLMKHALSEASLPRGFRFAATACGLKKTGALDLAVLSSDVPASAAAVFTQNLVVAAPVLISKEHLRTSKGRMRAVVVNAGNANSPPAKLATRPLYAWLPKPRSGWGARHKNCLSVRLAS